MTELPKRSDNTAYTLRAIVLVFRDTAPLSRNIVCAENVRKKLCPTNTKENHYQMMRLTG